VHTRFDLKNFKNACLSLSLQKIVNQKGWKMEKMVKVILLSLMLFVTFLNADVKNFYANGVGNTKQDAKYTSKKIQIVTGLKMQKPLYNQTDGIVNDLVEAAKMATDWDYIDIQLKNGKPYRFEVKYKNMWKYQVKIARKRYNFWYNQKTKKMLKKHQNVIKIYYLQI